MLKICSQVVRQDPPLGPRVLCDPRVPGEVHGTSRLQGPHLLEPSHSQVQHTNLRWVQQGAGHEGDEGEGKLKHVMDMFFKKYAHF